MLDEIKKVHKDDDLSVEEKIYNYKEAMYKTFQYDPIIFQNILNVQLGNTLSSLSTDLLNQITNLSREVMNMLADTYKQGVKSGKFEEGHGIVHADIMWAMFLGLVLWEDSKRKINPKKDFLKPTLDTAIKIFIRGVKKSENKK